MSPSDLKIFIELAEHLLNQEQEEPVAPYLDKGDLTTTIDFNLEDSGLLDEQLISHLKQLITYTPKTASKSFFNQLFGGRMPKATLGELLSVMLNNSMYTYKVAGPQVGIEKAIIAKVCELAGYPSTSGGTFAAGGSMTNFMALIMARDAKVPEIKKTGLDKTLTLYTSAESHYSIEKNTALSGIGSAMVRKVQTNAYGQLQSSHLETLIKEDLQMGLTPFFVNTTAGTTVLGAFDDLNTIQNICKSYDLWLHVDGAYCGGVIFSTSYKHLISGLEHSNSFSFNAHKMLGTPLSCSILITKHKDQLHHSFSNEADYLYQTADDDFNLGKISLQCGRRNDALKLWSLWKSIGTKGLEKLVDQQFYLADLARGYIRNHPAYELYSFDNSISICFNYKGVSAKQLCTLLYEQSKVMVGFGNRNNLDFIRLVTINSALDKSAIFQFFNTLESFVKLNFTENFIPSNPNKP